MTKPLHYLASPYTLYPRGLTQAFTDACVLQNRLRTQHKLRVYSPIAHSHNLSRATGVDPKDHKFWMACCRPWMEISDVLLIAMMDGWKQSKGVAEEGQFFALLGKPIIYLDCETLAFASEAGE